MDEPTITKEERQEWARLCEAATHGPWTVLENGGGLSWSIREPESGYRDGLEHEADARLIAAARSALPRLLTALDAAEQRAERAERERDGMYEALGMLTALHESDYDNEPPPARPAWLQDALGGEARKVADARDAAHYDAVTREMTRREAAESALATLEARLAEVAADPRLRLPYLIEAHEQDEWEPAEAHHDESDAEARRSGYECSTRVRALRAARAKREKGGAA